MSHDRPVTSASPTHDRGGAATSLDINALLEFSRLLNESEDAEFIYGNLLLSLMGKLRLGRAAVALPEADGQLRVAYVKGAAGDLAGLRFTWDGRRQIGLVDAARAGVAGLSDSHIGYLLPLGFGGAVFAVVLLGRPMLSEALDEDEVRYALLVGAIAAMALEGSRVRASLHEVNRRLERRIQRLRSLFEAGKEFNVSLDRSAILRLLGYTLMGEMAVARFAVALVSDGEFRLVVNRFTEKPSQRMLRWSGEQGVSILAERELLEGMGADMYDLGIRAAIPMEVQGEIRGVLLVGQRLRERIDEEDAEFLAALGNLAISALENARLLEEMIEKNRMEEDLRIAWQIQQGLLPKELPVLDGYEVAAQTVPSQQVGGDCYDVIDLDDGRILLSVADVSGKGTPASLLMANVQAALRTLARMEMPLSELAARINDVIHENTAVDKFITAFIGVLDTRSGTFRYVNAGHNPPLLVSGTTMTPLEDGGLIFGVMPTTIPYAVGEVRMEPNDLLLMYTDGVSEALDPVHEEYGEARLRALLAARAVTSASEAIERTRRDVLAFTQGAPQSDDITLVAVWRCPSAGV